jgi:hypothetical protein
MRPLLSFLTLLLLTVNSFGQNGQIYFESPDRSVRINQSIFDNEGYVINIGNLSINGDHEPVIFKTDKLGNLIWSKGFWDNDEQLTNISLAANGDYLIGSISGLGRYMRVTKNGQLSWAKQFYFNNNLGPQGTSIAELPNGHIAVCGQNDFSNPTSGAYHNIEGYLILLDSSGNTLSCHSYGKDPGVAHVDCRFYSVAVLGNKIYLAGSYYQPQFGYAALIVSTDLLGNMLSANILQDTIQANGVTLSTFYFSHIFAVNGGLYINSTTQTATLPMLTQQLFGRLDTSSLTLNGYCLSASPYSLINSQSIFVRDSSEYYSVINPTQPSMYSRMSFVSRIINGNIEYTKKIESDSTLGLNSILAYDDTVIISGIVYPTIKGFYGYFDQNFPTPLTCGMSDTTVQLTACSKILDLPSIPMDQAYHSVTSNPISYFYEVCILQRHLCGDTVCTGIIATIDTLTPTKVCTGDTIILHSNGCYSKHWYWNGTQLPDTDNILMVTQPGLYKVIADNGACSDTSQEIFADFYPLPVPVIHRTGDSLKTGVFFAYQWLDHNNDTIPHRKKRAFHPTAPGYYSVRVIDKHGCVGQSQPFYYTGPSNVSSTASYSSEVNIFPNPASSLLMIYNHGVGDAEVIITDLSGRSLQKFSVPPGKNEYLVSDLGLSNGVYLLYVHLKDETSVQKLVIGGKLE